MQEQDISVSQLLSHSPFLRHVAASLSGLGVYLQMVVEDGQVMANVHITPMRASRALALRYLATKFGIDMENVAVGPFEIVSCIR